MSIKTVHTRTELADIVGAWRRSGERVGLVPTMGNLHEGHLSLVRELRPQCDRLLVSIFVNPLQFGPNEDLDSYPRTLASDQEKLAAEGADLAFAPEVGEVYPDGEAAATVIEPPAALTDQLCGRDRPGFFTGVATVVAKLFNLCTPDVAIFGEKDFQQLLIIRRMVADLNFPVEIVSGPLIRESDGLAMSSRNHYLDAGQRRLAPMLYHVLTEVAAGVAADRTRIDPLLDQARDQLAEAGFEPRYLAVRNAETLGAPDANVPLRVFGAAHLSGTRLIDNVPVPEDA